MQSAEWTLRYSGKQEAKKDKRINPYGGVAQLGEHLPCKQGVRSSILLISTIGHEGTKERSTECLD